jgi:hypothetical protein
MRAFSQFLTCPGSLLSPRQATGVTRFFASSAVKSGNSRACAASSAGTNATVSLGEMSDAYACARLAQVSFAKPLSTLENVNPAVSLVVGNS